MNNKKQLDSYSILICSKYFTKEQDFINIICVNSKFQETTEKLRFNPIPIKSLTLFPKIQTQYLYDESDMKIVGVDNYEILYEVNYDQCFKFKGDNIKYRHVIYTCDNRLKYGDTIPINITDLGDNCFSDCASLLSINLSTTITKLGHRSFNNCTSLISITLPSTITSLNYYCFENCSSLTSIDLPPTLTELSYGCFTNCRSLKFVNLPPKLNILRDWCFMRCSSLTSIDLPSSLKEFGESCFYDCSQLKRIISVPKHCFHAPW
ncbi:Leucine rich repeat containing protein BspA family protein [Entamoeba marina]